MPSAWTSPIFWLRKVPAPIETAVSTYPMPGGLRPLAPKEAAAPCKKNFLNRCDHAESGQTIDSGAATSGSSLTPGGFCLRSRKIVGRTAWSLALLPSARHP